MGPGGMGTMGSGLGSLLRLDAEVARLRADLLALSAQLDGELRTLALWLDVPDVEAVAADPERYLGVRGSGRDVPELLLASIDVERAEADVLVARTARRPDLVVSSGVRVMPGGMFGGVDVGVGVTVPVWGGAGARIEAAEAGAVAAQRREEGVVRDLELARASALARYDAAEARATALEVEVLPRAERALDVTLGQFEAGTATAEEVLEAWSDALDIAREAVTARREARLRAADLDRLEGT
jgi:outer membrane protein, heavy metal efflux system